ncbi:hypothetical protein [Enterococcus ratti]|uniref:Uncharacterized protein n=1 Tax=Enterococcus ratti TaxID=150033 RepID=A0A1L8WEH1_9ENTE|nr:hypothetical protein [Enterococcus ratti]OJG79406.1 hypothetical protein RV14_GL000829 [Enterococcus ratti]
MEEMNKIIKQLISKGKTFDQSNGTQEFKRLMEQNKAIDQELNNQKKRIEYVAANGTKNLSEIPKIEKYNQLVMDKVYVLVALHSLNPNNQQINEQLAKLSNEYYGPKQLSALQTVENLSQEQLRATDKGTRSSELSNQPRKIQKIIFEATSKHFFDNMGKEKSSAKELNKNTVKRQDRN